MKNIKAFDHNKESSVDLAYLEDLQVEESEISGKASYEERSSLSPPKYKKILVVEDDVNHFGILEELIKEINPKAVIDWEVGMSGAVEKINSSRESPWRKNGYNLVISDVFLEDGDSGIDLLEFCNNLKPKVKCILISAYTLDNLKVNNEKLDYIKKPINFNLFYEKLAPILTS